MREAYFNNGGDAEKVDFYIAQISLKRLIPEKYAFH